MQQLNEAQEANKEMAIKLACAESKAAQLEASLRKEESTVAKLKAEKQVLIAEIDLAEEEKAGLEVQLIEAEEKKAVLRNTLLDAELELAKSRWMVGCLRLSRLCIGMAMGTRNPSTRRVLPDKKAGME